jgi:CDP-diacylglycerol--glycerol-3-phosphate 3-phosphatidyltransferase
MRRCGNVFKEACAEQYASLSSHAMSVANLITLVRGALVAPVVYLLLSGQRTAAAVLFVVVCIGDIVDGMVARARHEVTPLGKALDPIVDKALYVSLFSALLVLTELSPWAYGAFLAPQFGLGVGAIFLQVRRRKVQAARLIGKAASLLSFLALLFLLVRWPGGPELFYAAIATTYAAGVDYYLAARSLEKSTP